MIGKQAPKFNAGAIINGEEIVENFSLEQFIGKKNVVLFFYPKDNTPTCTEQACNLRDNYSLLKKEGFEVIGVSPDEEKKHKKFEAKYNLPFTLLADPEHKIIDKYGVWDEKQLYGRKYMGILRTTFVLDGKGIIRKIFLRPKNKQHAEEIVAAWKTI